MKMDVEAATSVLRFGVFEFDPVSGDLRKNGRSLRLQEQSRQVLVMLVTRPGELVTRDELRAALWPSDTFVEFDTALNVVINKLRTALGDSASSPRYIETLPRRGYRFLSPVSNPLSAAMPTAAQHVKLRSWRAALIAGSVLAVSAVAWSAWPTRSGPSSTPPATIRSVAVLPIEHLSSGGGADYLGQGITEALTTELASIRSLTVKAAESTRGYRASAKAISTIGEELGVDALVKGSVVRADGRLRLSIQLVDTKTQSLIWARAFEHDAADIVRLQQEIATHVTSQLRIALTDHERARLRRPVVVNAQAYDAYLRGRYILAGLPENDPNNAAALREFERAIELDPSLGVAYVGLGEVHQVRATYLGGHPPLENRRLALAAARRALELDPDLGDAHALLARIQLSELDWAGARRSFARMLELSPGNAPGLVWYAYSLLLDGKPDEAVEVARRAETLDPLNLNTRTRVGFVCSFTTHIDEAMRRYKEVLALDERNSMARHFLTAAYARRGMHNEELASAQEGVTRFGRTPLLLSHLAAAYERSGHHAKAQALLQELLSAARTSYIPPANMGFIYAAAGDRARALDWFERAYAERSNMIMFFPVEPLVAWPDDVRYRQLLAKIRSAHDIR